jgi:intimin
VIFTNLSPVGVLSSTTADTNNAGIATVTVKSTTEGFVTVQAEVNKDAGQARDRKTVFFSAYNVAQPAPELDLTVGQGDPFAGITVTATVFDGFGRLVTGVSVLFGSDSSEATFPLGDTAVTDMNGQASVLLKVVPSQLRPVPTVISIMALASNGAFNMVSLTLPPVDVASTPTSYLTADPPILNISGTSKIDAVVFLNTGSAAPDGITVNFRTTCGFITPFAQTTDGVAEATFTAPSTPARCTISGQVGNVHVGSVRVDVIIGPLAVQPKTASIDGATGDTATFTVSGGAPPYSITSTNPLFPPVPASITLSGGTFEVTVPSGTAATGVTYSIQDAFGNTASATLTITTAAGAMTVAPLAATICENSAPCAGATSPTAMFTITGGTLPYTVVSDNTAVIPSPGSPGGNTFTVDANNGSIDANTTVTLTITDSAGTPATVTRTVTVINQP